MKDASGLFKSENPSQAGLQRGERLTKRPALDVEELMRLIFVVEARKPCGTTLRMALGVTIPLALFGAALGLARLF